MSPSAGRLAVKSTVPNRRKRATQPAGRRRGATMVEVAFVLPVVIFFVLMQVVGAMGVFRYQEVAHLAREGARYASTHGATYQEEGVAEQTGVPSISSSSGLRSYLIGRTVALDSSLLQVDVSYTAPSGVNPVNQPIFVDPDPNLVPPGQKTVQNYVIVTVSYQWTPGLFNLAPITLTSTSEMPMVY